MKQLITELTKEEEKAIYGRGWIIIDGEIIFIYEMTKSVNLALTE